MGRSRLASPPIGHAKEFFNQVSGAPTGARPSIELDQQCTPIDWRGPCEAVRAHIVSNATEAWSRPTLAASKGTDTASERGWGGNTGDQNCLPPINSFQSLYPFCEAVDDYS